MAKKPKKVRKIRKRREREEAICQNCNKTYKRLPEQKWKILCYGCYCDIKFANMVLDLELKKAEYLDRKCPPKTDSGLPSSPSSPQDPQSSR